MHLNPESLSFALLISDLGSIARAANILGMKQATLSRKLTALESRVGVRLFDRSTRGAVPTVSGAGFLNQARRIVADKAGESWSEPPGANHPISRNARKTQPAKLLAVFVVDTDDKDLTTPVK